MKKIILLCVILALVLPCALCGCSPRETKEELLAAAKSIFSEVELLSLVYYGSGIPSVEGEAGEKYLPADPDFVKEHGIATMDALTQKSKAVFSEVLWRDIEDNILSPLQDADGTVRRVVRYYEVEATAEKAAYLMVHTGHEPTIRGDNRFLTESLRVVEHERNRAVVALQVEAYLGEDVQTKEVEYTLVWENDAWRLDSIPCVSYLEKK